jgi:hypothetical protein
MKTNVDQTEERSEIWTEVYGCSQQTNGITYVFDVLMHNILAWIEFMIAQKLLYGRTQLRIFTYSPLAC